MHPFALGSFFTTWTTGILNGYTLEKGGLPTGIKYTVMGFTSVFGIMNGLSKLPTPIPRSTSVGSLFLIPPLLAGSVFCVGDQFGKALRIGMKTPT
jgi:hypothetical protein